MTWNWDKNEWVGNKQLSIPIEEYRRRKEIVLKENGKVYRGDNNNQICFLTFRIDGGIIRSNEEIKCDYLFFDEDIKNVFFIELKGKDIPHAFEQLKNAISLLKPALELKAGHNKFSILGRIVCKSFPSGVFNKPSTKKCMDDFKKIYKTRLVVMESGRVDILSSHY